jgi:hypothetical protein
MDPLVTDEVVATQQAVSTAGILTLVLIIGVVLIGIIILQNRKIREMQKPKYGFLGKPLNAFILMAILLGGVGFVYYSTNSNENDFVDVSADSELEASIIVTQVDVANRIYKFNLVPAIDSKEWGGNNIYKFDVQWTVSNGEVYQAIENDLSNQNLGGVTLTLKPGTYKVSATVFIDDKSEEVILNPNLVVE